MLTAVVQEPPVSAADFEQALDFCFIFFDKVIPYRNTIFEVIFSPVLNRRILRDFGHIIMPVISKTVKVFKLFRRRAFFQNQSPAVRTLAIHWVHRIL